MSISKNDDECEKMNFDDYNFKDYKNNEVYCSECEIRLVYCSEQIIGDCLCASCLDELEEHYKSEHPEEYD